MAAPKLEWKYFAGTNTEGFLYTEHWRIKAKFDWNEARTTFIAESSQDGSSGSFSTMDDAKAWCQAREDEAWAAANPPREFSDTEILDCLESGVICEFDSRYDKWFVQKKGSNDFGCKGKNRREAVTAYLRANPPATAEPASEPVPDREMTLRELEEKCLENSLHVRFNPMNPHEDKSNIWPYGQAGESDLDVYAPTLTEALAKCLAAIESRKARTDE